MSLSLSLSYKYAYASMLMRPYPASGRSELRCLMLQLALQLLPTRRSNAPATLQYAATAASWPPGRSCNAAGLCNCYFLAFAALLQRSKILQLLLPGLCCAPATLLEAASATSGLCNAPAALADAAYAALQQRSQILQLLLPGLCSAPAKLLDAASAASGLWNVSAALPDVASDAILQCS